MSAKEFASHKSGYTWGLKHRLLPRKPIRRVATGVGANEMPKRKRHAIAIATTPPANKKTKAAIFSAEVSAAFRTYLGRWGDGTKLNGGFTGKHTPDEHLVRKLRHAVENPGQAERSVDAIYEVICAYSVARNFKLGMGGFRRYELLPPVLQFLHGRWLSVREELATLPAERCIAEVDALADELHVRIGSRNLCAASKLWVLLGMATPIYDSVARGQLFKSTAAMAYGEYHTEWTAHFAPVRRSYEVAADAHDCPTSVLVGREWFLMRAFDQFLLDQADAKKMKRAAKTEVK